MSVRSVLMLILHHFVWWQKNLKSVCSIIQRGKYSWKSSFKKALFKRHYGQKQKEDEEEKETIARRKRHTNNKKKKWRKQLLCHHHVGVSVQTHTKTHNCIFYNNFKFSLRTWAFHWFYWKLMSLLREREWHLDT